VGLCGSNIYYGSGSPGRRHVPTVGKKDSSYLSSTFYKWRILNA
jgi:hypothetical protein